MKIIEYFEIENKKYWLSKIKESDWGAAQFLSILLEKEELKKLTGENTKLFLLVDGYELISFCTLSDVDDIDTLELTPWIGFVFTFSKYRGKRYIEKLLQHAENAAKAKHFQYVYISTDQIGLYEKYGYTFMKIMKDRSDEDSRIYYKSL